MVEEDFRSEMRKINVPMLFIHGDSDQSAPLELTGKPSSDLVPDCRLIVYEGGPHGLMFTHMERLNADILEFVGSAQTAELDLVGSLAMAQARGLQVGLAAIDRDLLR